MAATFRVPGADAEAAWSMWMHRQRYAAEIREYMDAGGCTFLDAEVAVRVANRLRGSEFTFLGPEGLSVEDFDV